MYGLIIPEVSYKQGYDQSFAMKELTFTKDECGNRVWVCSADEKDDSQHDYSISKKDWEKIKFVVDTFFETC